MQDFSFKTRSQVITWAAKAMVTQFASTYKHDQASMG